MVNEMQSVGFVINNQQPASLLIMSDAASYIARQRHGVHFHKLSNFDFCGSLARMKLPS